MALFRSKPEVDERTHPFSTLGDPISFVGDAEMGVTSCQDCLATHRTSYGYLLRNSAPFAMYIASANPHTGESWIDMTIGSFKQPKFRDNVLFACRIDPADELGRTGCTLVRPTWGGDNPPQILGAPVERDVALLHTWLPDFWNAVDWLVANEPFFGRATLALPSTSLPQAALPSGSVSAAA